MPIIDSAVCLPFVEGKPHVRPWLDLMDRWAIAHAVIAPTDEYVAVYNEAGNDAIVEVVSQYPEKLSGLAVSNPWYGKAAAETLERAFDGGLKGLYLHPARQGFHLTDTVVDPLIEVCAARGKSVYCCTGTPVCAMPFQLAELAHRFPSVEFVLGHMGWSDFSGYDVIPAALQSANIYIETSCTTGAMVAAAIEALGPERVLFGSGYPRSSPQPELLKIEWLKLPPATLDALMSGNARALWGIAR